MSEEEDQPAPRARHPLGIGSKFSVSADGRLQQGPRSTDRQQGRPRTWTEASGALQGVSPPLTTSEGSSPATDTFSDAIMLSRGSKSKGPASKLYAIYDETEMVPGRGDFEPAHSAHLDSRVPPPFMSSSSGTPDDSPAWDGGGASLAADADDSGVAAVPQQRPFKVTQGKTEKPKNEAQIKREKHLVAQIKELERQLEKETLRKKEQAKASKRKERRRLVVCSRWLPFGLQVRAEGPWPLTLPLPLTPNSNPHPHPHPHSHPHPYPDQLDEQYALVSHAAAVAAAQADGSTSGAGAAGAAAGGAAAAAVTMLRRLDLCIAWSNATMQVRA